MDDIRRRMEGAEPQAAEPPEERDRIYCFKCDEQFVVEHVLENEAWVCPACAHPNLNLHRHFLALGVLFALVAVAGLVRTVLYALAHLESDIALLYLMWSCVQMTVSGYAVMAIFGDRRAYGLRPLRYLLPALYASAVAAAITYWFPYHLLTVIGAGLAFAGIGAYGGYVFWHTFRMAVPHKAREAVVRPMYTLISVTVHVLLLLYMGLVTVIIPQRTAGPSPIEIGNGGPLTVAPFNPVKPEEPVKEPPAPTLTIEPNFIPLEAPDIPYKSDSPTTFMTHREDQQPRIASTYRVPKPYEARRNPGDAAKTRGGSDLTEDAVIRALRWLQAHQNEDGSWGEGSTKVAATSLALLCFLGHGEDQPSSAFAPTVRGAILWLEGQQDEDGYFCRGQSWCYQNGMAVYAMAEAYAMMGLQEMRPVVAKAVRRVCEGQTPEGGWYYNYAKARDDGSAWPGGDTSVSGWQIQALTAAWYSGIRFADDMLAEARAQAAKDIKSRFDDANGCGYQGTGPSRSKEENYCTTAVGTLCLQFLGEQRAPQVASGLKLMRAYSCDWERTTGGAGDPLYGWYYVTQAMYQAGGENSLWWDYWNPLFKTMLLTRQQADGHWEPPTNAKYAAQFGSNGRLVYSTTMCCLMLEVYYRCLPTFRAAH